MQKMSITTQALHKLNSFFDDYAKAFESFDTKLMSQHYAIPCTFLTDDSAQVFTEASKLEGLFNQGTTFYKQFGIAHARPEIWSKRQWSERIAKAKVNWKYYDAGNNPVYNCDYMYVLKLDKHNKWKIEVSVSVNEKERMEEWMKSVDSG